jgi:transcription initiation factor TFIID TATA-box-binding protein
MKIVSTMGSGSLGREVELETLVSELEEEIGDVVDANFHNPGMVTFRLEEDGDAYTIYRTGTFQIRGAESTELLTHSFDRLKKSLDEIGFDVPETKFEQVTSVFLEDIDSELHLEALAVVLGLENTEYEPEQFPGLIYRPGEYEVTLLIFASGKVIVGGTTDRSSAKSAVQHLQAQASLLDSA